MEIFLAQKKPPDEGNIAVLAAKINRPVDRA